MLTTVLVFALITAIFELCVLLKFSSIAWLTGCKKIFVGWRKDAETKRYVRKYVTLEHSHVVHVVAMVANLIVHWGTIVGTMTAITAGLVSFCTVPVAIWFMKVRTNETV